MKTNMKSIAEGLKATLGKLGKAGEGAIEGTKDIKEKFSKAAEGLAKEAEISPVLHEQAVGALERVVAENASLKRVVAEAHGYAVFPSVARASIVLGVSYGLGEVFEKRRVIGYAGVVQVTVGVQLGGETLDMLVIMDDADAMERFKSGKVSFAATASLALVGGGTIAGRSPSGLHVYLYSEGGEMLEAAIGGQTFKFRPAALGRLRRAPKIEAGPEEQGEERGQSEPDQPEDQPADQG